MRYARLVSSTTIGDMEPAVPRANTRLAYDAIRSRIVDGQAAPGQWLRESTVADSLGLSRTPVREALRMLATEGLVEMVPNRGARVVSWTQADIDEVYRLRALLEGHGAALAARAASREQVSQIRRLGEIYERAIDSAVPGHDETARCNNEFHAAILAASGSPRLTNLLDVISSAPMVTQALSLYSDDDRRRSVLQHRDILTAIANGDAELAESAMRSHILAARYTARGLGDVPRAGPDSQTSEARSVEVVRTQADPP
jgi:DNA-binding GntR family transcriptional regulator